MTIEHEELSELVPHKGKMFIIGRISDIDVKEWIAESETKITPDFMFYEKSIDGVPNYACFEIIAQTVSALTGLYVRVYGLPPNMGFILSVSNLRFDFDVVRSGSVVKVRAKRESALDNVYSFEATVFVDGKEAGGGKLTVMEVKEENL
ncbi:MAG: hypothetical protein IJ727_10480 [Treponema sp.]|nr:hypothetical protein [Treponema sp.]